MFQTVPFESLFASALLFSLLADSATGALVVIRPLTFLGEISYGLYLYHELVFDAFHGFLSRRGVVNHWNPLVWALGFLVESGLAILIAYLSKRFFENRFLRIFAFIALCR